MTKVLLRFLLFAGICFSAKLSAGGVLRLLTRRGGFYRFKDELNYGLEHCVSGGRTEIHFINSGLAVFQWFNKNGVLKVEGHLKRQAQLMI